VSQEPADLPAWSLPAGAGERISIGVDWPERVTRDWALGGATGKGVRVCILDSGIETGHPRVGAVDGAVAFRRGKDDEIELEEDTEGDLCGHGTACAGIVRQLAPECGLHSARVLGAGFKGSGPVLLEGLRWAVDQGFEVINMSLSTTKRQFAELLHELADTAYFRRTVLVASAHNMPVESYPWRFSSVISVGSHEEPDPLTFFYNPSPPVEFFARCRRRDRVARRRHDPLDRKQLRHAAHERHLCPDHVEAPRADALPAEERALPDREQRGRRTMSDLRAAVAAGALGSEESYRELLQSIVEVARAIFGARASSVFLFEEESDELVFEAVAGEGAEELIGKRFPSSTGIAGWVLVTRQPLVVEELDKDPRFSRETAESTGFVPKGLMAVPLLHEDRALGVLEVLDRPQQAAFSLAEMELLGLFASEAAIALDLLQKARAARAVLEQEGGDAGALARFAARLDEADEEKREAALQLLDALGKLLRER